MSNETIPYCLPTNKPNRISGHTGGICGMNFVKYNLLTTGGNDPKQSQKMKYANYVKNFSKSRPIQSDICPSIQLDPSHRNSYNQYTKQTCTNPIFSASWRGKIGLQKCCATLQSLN